MSNNNVYASFNDNTNENHALMAITSVTNIASKRDWKGNDSVILNHTAVTMDGSSSESEGGLPVNVVVEVRPTTPAGYRQGRSIHSTSSIGPGENRMVLILYVGICLIIVSSIFWAPYIGDFISYILIHFWYKDRA